jgi:hypothetical protein
MTVPTATGPRLQATAVETSKCQQSFHSPSSKRLAAKEKNDNVRRIVKYGAPP